MLYNNQLQNQQKGLDTNEKLHHNFDSRQQTADSRQQTADSRQPITVNFFCTWSRDRKTSWSGIHYSLFTSLQQYANVIDIPLLDSFTARLARKLKHIADKLTRSDNFMVFDSKIMQAEIESSKLPAHDAPCIMFHAVPSRYMQNTYMYQDLTVDFVYRMWKEKSPLSRFTPLPPNTKESIVHERLELNRQVNENCRGLLTMSQWLAKDLAVNTGIDARKIHHVGGGCNINTSLIDTHGKNGKRFLFVGRDWERKNGPLAAEAFAKLHRKYPDAELYIAGPSTAPQELDGISGVNFLGLLSYDELVHYYNLCDFFVMPSRFEAYGIVFAEALIFGLPCIGKDICAMPEFIQDGKNGMLIHDDDPDELADCMERLLLDRNNFVSYVEAMHDKYLTQYSWKSVAERIIDVMRQDGF